MRIPTYMSYSSFSSYEKNNEEFFLKYLAETRAPRLPQEQPASIGSAFDARVKSSLYESLFGVGHDVKYSYAALFEAQVEEHNRDWAKDEAEYVFESYKLSGMYDELLALLQKSIEPPRFEFDVRETILGVPFLCKPDCRFVLQGPLHVVHDWKVNGYCSKSAVSPVKGYRLCKDGYVSEKPSRSHDTTHKQFVEQTLHGLALDTGYMEDCSTGWADQLSIYGWSLGEKVGDQNVVLSVDQIVGKPLVVGRPLLRVASFRARVRESYQEHLAKRIQDCWEVINSGYIFQDLSEEDSKTRQAMLEDQSIGLQSDGTPLDNFFSECVRPKYRG